MKTDRDPAQVDPQIMDFKSSVNAVEPRASFALFAYGFRPFFWAAAVYAVVGIAAWWQVFQRGAMPLPGLPAQLWHGHELMFGFVGAAIAGFLLTAVPSWTSERGYAGPPLVALAAVWLAGRIAIAAAGVLPFTVVAAVELAFLPALAFLVAPPLLRTHNRNTPLLFVLAALWAADVAFTYACAEGNVALARNALYIALDIVLLLITVIGGRIVPVFTASGLRSRAIAVDIRTRGWLDTVTIGAMAAVVIVDVAAPWRPIAGFAAAVAALAQAVRLAGWRGFRTTSVPLVWSLHLAYAWLPVGLAMKAVHLTTGAAWSTHWLHALTIGAAAAMILAVMTRAALGHTGRPLVASGAVAVAYALLALSAVVRVFAPAVVPMSYPGTVTVAASLWIASFGLFLIVYTPILWQPRIDGRPG